MDRSQEEYDKYTEDMPWWCLPYAISTLPKLAELYEASGLPYLVVLDIDGSVITKEGVQNLRMDPVGKRFPWRPQPLVDIMPKTYVASSLVEHSIDDLEEKYIMLFFASKTCDLCAEFTPWLIKAYNILKERRPGDFELLFVCCDDSQADFDSYFATMPWGAIPFDDRETKKNLEKRFEITNYPTLVMVGPVNYDEGEDRPLINPDIRAVIETGDYISDFPYYPKPFGDFCTTTDDINTHKCLIVFHEGGEMDDQDEVEEAVKQAAMDYRGDEIIKFYWAFDDEVPLVANTRQACDLGPLQEEPTMVLLDIPDDGAFYVSEETEVTVDTIKFFLMNHGERQQI